VSKQKNGETDIIENVVKKLIETGYKEGLAHSLGERLVASIPIRKPLMIWLQTGEETDCVYEEISALTLKRERGLWYPAALGAIAWLHREPEIARKALTEPTCILE